MNDKDTRTRILDVAQDLIQRLGVNAMSYQHISDAVGIRKASIHHHFPAKEDLVQALVERYNGFFLEVVDGIVASEADAPTKLARYIGLFEATLSESQGDKVCLCAMLGAELTTLGSASAASVRRFFAENEDRLIVILEQGRQESSIRFAGDSRHIARMIVSLLEGAMLVSRTTGGLPYLISVRDGLLDLLVH